MSKGSAGQDIRTSHHLLEISSAHLTETRKHVGNHPLSLQVVLHLRIRVMHSHSWTMRVSWEVNGSKSHFQSVSSRENILYGHVRVILRRDISARFFCSDLKTERHGEGFITSLKTRHGMNPGLLHTNSIPLSDTHITVSLFKQSDMTSQRVPLHISRNSTWAGSKIHPPYHPPRRRNQIHVLSARNIRVSLSHPRQQPSRIESAETVSHPYPHPQHSSRTTHGTVSIQTRKHVGFLPSHIPAQHRLDTRGMKSRQQATLNIPENGSKSNSRSV